MDDQENSEADLEEIVEEIVEEVIYGDQENIEPSNPPTPKKRRIVYHEIMRFNDENSFDQWLKTTQWTRYFIYQSRTKLAYLYLTHYRAHKNRGQNQFFKCRFSQRKGYECKAHLRVVRNLSPKRWSIHFCCPLPLNPGAREVALVSQRMLYRLIKFKLNFYDFFRIKIYYNNVEELLSSVSEFN